MYAPGMSELPESARPKPLTRRAHERIAAHLHPGDLALDATAGNGHDTLFLARSVGAEGHVWALDIQHAAIESTRRRLKEQALEERVTLIQAGHERMAQLLPESAQGRLRVVMFNLGYLPGSDKHVTTTAESTLAALEAAESMRAPDGLLSVLVYRGHAGAGWEARAVADWMQHRRAERLGGQADQDPILYLLGSV